MNVVIDSRLILPEMTGIGHYINGLASELQNVSEEDTFELWLQNSLPSDHDIWQQVGERVHLYTLPINHMAISAQWIIPNKLIRKKIVDLFHYPHFDLPFAVPGPVVATIHDLKYIAYPSFFPRMGSLKRLIMRLMMWFTVRRANRIIAVSESTRQDILSFLGADPAKVVVIPEGVEEEYFEFPDGDFTNKILDDYGLIVPYILFVGERRPHKNIPGLIKSYDVFRKKYHHKHHLVIAGKGYMDYDEPERLTETLGLSDRVHFLDYVPPKHLPSLYRRADVFVLLSSYEGFGLPILEAMASSTPVVAANKTSLPEVVGDAGILVDSGKPEEVADLLSQVVKGGCQRDDYIQRGLERARHFTWRDCANQTVEVYRDVVNL